MRNILYVLIVTLLFVLVIVSISFSEKPLFNTEASETQKEITTKKIETFQGGIITITNTHPVSKEKSLVTITTEGFSNNETITLENNALSDIFFVDVNNDVYEELILIFTSSEETKQSEAVIFTTYDNIGLSKIETPNIDSESTSEGGPFEGYIGFDTFKIQSSRLVHEFKTTTQGTPIIRKKDYLKKIPVQNEEQIEENIPTSSSTEQVPQVLGVATSTEQEVPIDESSLVDPFEVITQDAFNENKEESDKRQDPFSENNETKTEPDENYFTRSLVYHIIETQDSFVVELEDAPSSNAETVASSTFALSGSVWEWSSAIADDNTIITPIKKQLFVLSFSGADTFISSTDCGEFSGTYIAGGGFVTFGNFSQTKTQSECKDSQEQTYRQLLLNVESYSVRGNKLFLTLSNEKTMIFSK
jgi:heat shock protein HslJ